VSWGGPRETGEGGGEKVREGGLERAWWGLGVGFGKEKGAGGGVGEVEGGRGSSGEGEEKEVEGMVVFDGRGAAGGVWGDRGVARERGRVAEGRGKGRGGIEEGGMVLG